MNSWFKLFAEERLQPLSRIFNALGSTMRLRIILMLKHTKRPLHIKAISKELDVDYATVYRNIEILREAGLLEVYEVGRSRVLSLMRPEVVNEFLGYATKLSGADAGIQ